MNLTYLGLRSRVVTWLGGSRSSRRFPLHTGPRIQSLDQSTYPRGWWRKPNSACSRPSHLRALVLSREHHTKPLRSIW